MKIFTALLKSVKKIVSTIKFSLQFWKKLEYIEKGKEYKNRNNFFLAIDEAYNEIDLEKNNRNNKSFVSLTSRCLATVKNEDKTLLSWRKYLKYTTYVNVILFFIISFGGIIFIMQAVGVYETSGNMTFIAFDAIFGMINMLFIFIIMFALMSAMKYTWSSIFFMKKPAFQKLLVVTLNSKKYLNIFLSHLDVRVIRLSHQIDKSEERINAVKSYEQLDNPEAYKILASCNDRHLKHLDSGSYTNYLVENYQESHLLRIRSKKSEYISSLERTNNCIALLQEYGI